MGCGPRFAALAVAALLAGWGMPAWAEDCSKVLNAMDLEDCAAKEQKVVEARLNSTYQKLMRRLDGQEGGEKNQALRQAVLEAQRAWVRFREADCRAVYTQHGGSARNLQVIGCLQSHAEQRLRELDDFMER